MSSNSAPYDLIIQNATVATPNGLQDVNVAVAAGKIKKISTSQDMTAKEVYQAKGLTLLPGVMDTQVHFREPGLEYKEDLESGTRAAALGGITAIFDMPNTKPNLLTAADLQDKLDRAAGRAWVDHAFFIGAAKENIPNLAELEKLPGCCGIKIFMGSSTGSLLVADDDTLEAVLRQGYRRVAVHCEDEHRLIERAALVENSGDPALHPVWRDEETALRATTRLLKAARKTGRRVHCLHITTAAEMALLAENKDIASVEVLPQHLTLSAPDCYEKLGSFAQMNPPIRDIGNQNGLWQAIQDGIVDCLGSDHAPHTKEEKARPYPQSPSGMPGVQTLLPLMLNHVANGKLTLQRLIDLTSAGPARLYQMAGKGRIALGYDADFTLVDLKAQHTLSHDQMASKCGWTPFDGMTLTGKPMATIIRGNIVMRDGALCGTQIGKPVRFQETLSS